MRLQVFKIMVATGLAISLAQVLGLDYATSAGIIAMLSVLETRRASLRVAGQRLFFTFLALTLASSSFTLFGFHLPAFLLYLLVMVSLAYRVRAQAAIAPCSVLVTHVWLEQDLSFIFWGNEILLMLLGTGTALLLHLYMPSKQSQIAASRKAIEHYLRSLLTQMSDTLEKGMFLDEQGQLTLLEEELARAKRLIYQERDNQLFEYLDYDWHYVQMRQEQVSLLKRMIANLGHCHLDNHQGKQLAQLFALTADELDEYNPARELLAAIDSLLQDFRGQDLPQTRQEFETRAILFQLLTDLGRFIELKTTFYALEHD